jgi:DNA-binding transcriptional LysR family regulator
MLSTYDLACLDLAIWLRSGEAAADRLNSHATTVGRRRRHSLEVLGISLGKQEQEWTVEGDTRLLAGLRHHHQVARWQGGEPSPGPLRLEATYWSGPLLASPAPTGWMIGAFDVVGVDRPLRWLREGLIDAWIGAGPDWPDPEDPDLATIPLCTLPVHLVVAPGHPLLSNPAPDWDAVAAFPSLALPEGAYPRVEAALRQLGLWNSPVRMLRYRRQLWEGRTEQQLTVGYATVLSEQVAGAMPRLPLALPFSSGEALVVPRAWQDHPRCRELVAELRRRLAPLAARFPEIVLAPASP